MPIKLLDYMAGVKPECSIHVPMYFESFREGNTVNPGGLCPQVPPTATLLCVQISQHLELRLPALVTSSCQSE